MVRTTLRELRRYVDLQLMFEAADVGVLASRGMRGRGIVIDDDGDGEAIMAVSRTDTERYKVAHHCELPKVLGAVVGSPDGPRIDDGQQAWTLRTMYADDPSTMVLLLAAVLSRWRVIVPDASVSPAAEAVVKRYYLSYKDDPIRVIMKPVASREHDQESLDDEMRRYVSQDRDERRALHPTKPWLFAAYLGPVPGFDLAAAVKAGDAAVEACVLPTNPPVKDADHVKRWVRLVGGMGFGAAYADPDKTGTMKVSMGMFDDLLQKVTRGGEPDLVLTRALRRALDAGSSSNARSIALRWYKDNKDDVDEALADDRDWPVIGPELLATS